jgi:hypothetical protein
MKENKDRNKEGIKNMMTILHGMKLVLHLANLTFV